MIRLVLIILLICSALIAGGWYLASQQPQLLDRYLPTSVTRYLPTQEQLPEIAAPDLGQLPETTQQQLSTLSERSQQVNSQVQQVLGAYVGVNPEATASGDKSLSQQALDHGLYLYCKGVVDAVEKKNGE